MSLMDAWSSGSFFLPEVHFIFIPSDFLCLQAFREKEFCNNCLLSTSSVFLGIIHSFTENYDVVLLVEI